MYKTRKSCDFTFLTLPFHKTSHYLLALYPNCLLFFFYMFHGIEGLFLRQICVALFSHEATTEDENSRITIPKINMMMSKAD